jgi:hypothetical protein
MVGIVLLLVGGCEPRQPPFSASALDRARAAEASIDGARVEAHVREIVANRVGAPTEMSSWDFAPLERRRSASYVEAAFTDMGLVPVVESDTSLGIETRNIYADVRGSEHPEQIVLVSGHYDAWYGSGADDNGSAIAVVLEAARVLAPTSPRRTIRFMAFDREEEGLIGSSRYLTRHTGDALVVMINMDCVGFTSNEPGSQSAPPGLALRNRGNFLAALANQPGTEMVSRFVQLNTLLSTGIDVLGLVAPSDAREPATAAFLRSDHAPFWRAGVPAIFLTDTGNLRNPHYHTVTDQPDTLDYQFLSGVARVVAGAAAGFAEGQ